jgi:DNA-binding beta-propeller fold protein YncE
MTCCVTSALLYLFAPLAIASADQTVYATGLNNTAAGGLGGFNPQTGVSSHNLAFEDIEVYPQVTADGTEAAYIRQSMPGSYSVAVYSVSTGTLVGSIPLPTDGTLALSPNSVSAYINGIEDGTYHIIEVNLDTLSVVLDVDYSSVSSEGPEPLAVSPDGSTVYAEDPLYLYRLDASTLQTTGSSTYTLPGGIFVTPNGEDLFTVAEANGSGEAIEFVSTETLSGTKPVNLPPIFVYAFTTALKISADGSTIVVLGSLENDGMEGSFQPIGILDIATRKFSGTAFPGTSYSDMAPNKDGSKIYLSDSTGLISIFDVQSQTVTPAFEAAAAVATLQLGTNGTLYVGYLLNIAPVVSVDLTTNQVAHSFSLPTGELPGFNILVNAEGSRLYASGRPTAVSATNVSTERFGPVPPTGLTYSSLAWASGQTGIWAAGPFSLDLLDPKTLAVTKSILLEGGNTPLGINALAVTPDQAKAVLTFGTNPNAGDGSGVLFVDLAAGTLTGSLVLDAPSYIAFSPDGSFAYVASVRLGQGYPQPFYPVISVVDINTYLVVRTMSIPVAANRVAFSLAISSDGRALYTTAAGTVFAFDSVSGKLIWTAAPGVETLQVATIPGSTDLITSDLGSTNLWRLSSTGTVLRSINAGIPTSYVTAVAN